MKVFDKVCRTMHEMSKERLISSIVEDSVGYGEGQLEILASRVEKLTQIVGALAEHLPDEAMKKILERSCSYRYEIEDEE